MYSEFDCTAPCFINLYYGYVCSYLEQKGMDVRVTHKRYKNKDKKRNKSISQQVRGHASCLEKTSICIHFQDTLRNEWKRKLNKKAENNNVDHILSLCISFKEIDLVDPWLPFQMTKWISGVQWSSFCIMALTTRLKPPFQINTFEPFFFWSHEVIVSASQRGPEGMTSSLSRVRCGVPRW